jgi:hypothetical protein
MSVHSLSAVLAWLSVAGQITPMPAVRTTVQVRTPVFGIAPHEQLVLRAIEVRPGAPPAQLRAVFLDEQNQVVAQTDTVALVPGQAFTFRVPYAALGTTDPFPGVRAVVTLELVAGGQDNRVLLNMEFFDVERWTARPGVSCAMSAQGGAEFMCTGPVDTFTPVALPLP